MAHGFAVLSRADEHRPGALGSSALSVLGQYSQIVNGIRQHLESYVLQTSKKGKENKENSTRCYQMKLSTITNFWNLKFGEKQISGTSGTSHECPKE